MERPSGCAYVAVSSKVGIAKAVFHQPDLQLVRIIVTQCLYD